ncbi:MAG: RNA methyltransferase [Gammaproteobacteria bacterium]|nr:RNA methyltransferase [Gammaproteobacteria bacterium]MCY4219340.1 RNA methyltransferase [Gammaproteobacteria bacterium]MCY4275851.1 RNA methyltransferase [Gammaproteobacteria bacterium]
MKPPNYIRIVLVEPSEPGNVGGIARCMANMGINNLTLVNAPNIVNSVALRRASGAQHILREAKHYPTLEQAIEGCTLVFGTTSRKRAINWPTLLPDQAMQKAIRQNARLAVIFGRERNGLENTELDLCNYMIRIDVDEGYPSMNLASAATILCYEFRKALWSGKTLPTIEESENLANAEQVNGFITHLENTLSMTEFLDGRSSLLMRKLKRLFNRSQLTKEEVNILRGILKSMENKVSR